MDWVTIAFSGFYEPITDAAANQIFLAAVAFGVFMAYRRHTGDWPVTMARYFVYAALAFTPCAIVRDCEGVGVNSELSGGAIVVYGLMEVVMPLLPALALLSATRRRPAALYAAIERIDWTQIGARVPAVLEMLKTRLRRPARETTTGEDATAPQASTAPAAPIGSTKYRKGSMPVTVNNPDGTTSIIWVPVTAQLPLSQRIHNYFGIAKHAVWCVGGLWIFFMLPGWMRPIVEVGGAAWFMGFGSIFRHLLPF